MNTKILLLVLFICTISIILAQNHMDIMTTMTGEHNFALMGDMMTTLDWNGDGHDDLVISENGWRPAEYIGNNNVRSYGKLNFYLGGQNFDNIPEITLPGSYQQEYLYTFSMCNAGHMNNDQYDDLALFRATPFEGDPQLYDLQLCIFYGGANPDTIPDYVITFPWEEWSNTYCFVRCLGDINHDGFDDLGYIMNYEAHSSRILVGIINGGSMENTVFRDINNIRQSADICGIGDVNSDGTDDFCLGYGHGTASNPYNKIMLYFGNSSGMNRDSLLIVDSSDIRSSFSYPAGDTNWDGYADFVSSFSMIDARLYYGGPGFDGTQFTTISPSYNGVNSDNGEGFAHGDVNGNGTDDLMGTYCSQLDFGYGDAFLWMGGVPMNGGADLYIAPPPVSDMEMFGWCLTMGDYNGDGCCDAAISAPFDYAGFPTHGRVFVYAGNPQLNDPTPISDNTNTPVISKMQLYPNPLQPHSSELNVKFTKQIGNQYSTFDIYNIRGKKVKSFSISAEQSKSGSASYNLNDLSSGVYLCIYTNGEQKQKGKITIIR